MEELSIMIQVFLCISIGISIFALFDLIRLLFNIFKNQKLKSVIWSMFYGWLVKETEEFSKLTEEHQKQLIGGSLFMYLMALTPFVNVLIISLLLISAVAVKIPDKIGALLVKYIHSKIK